MAVCRCRTGRGRHWLTTNIERWLKSWQHKINTQKAQKSFLSGEGFLVQQEIVKGGEGPLSPEGKFEKLIFLSRRERAKIHPM